MLQNPSPYLFSLSLHKTLVHRSFLLLVESIFAGGMVLQTATPTTTPAPHVVGNAFVHQYYHVLLTSPDLVHRFYQDSSILSRSNSDEVMTSAINDKLLSYNFNRSEIESIDSQASYHNGVMIVVTGCLTGNDNSQRKFTQSFFLAPQDNGGFFVLNDIFRFLDQPNESNQILADGNEDAPNSPPTPAPESNLDQENHVGDVTSPTSESVPIDYEEVVNPSEHGSSGIEDEVAVDPPVQKQSDELPVQEVATLASSVPQDDGNKKSYASIVKVMNDSMPQKSASVPTSKSKTPVKTAMSSEKLVNVPTAPAPTPETRNPGSNNVPEKIGSQDVEGHSIYIRNLPQNATPEQVERELKKFGSIKPGGVQVRNHKIDRFCFGFVEFESESAMQDAIKASPITMEGRRVFFEEKRTSTRVVNGVVISNGNGNWRGRFLPGRGGFRNDYLRGRGGNFVGNNQGYGRAEFRNRGEFSGHGRGRGQPGNVGEGYHHRAIQNGNGRAGRPMTMNQTAVSS